MVIQISFRLLFINCGAYFCWEAVPPLLVKGNGDDPEEEEDQFLAMMIRCVCVCGGGGEEVRVTEGLAPDPR